MGLGLITCGEVEDVVGVLTPVVGGVVQVFHELLVELRLLLVAEVEEGEEEEEQEEGWEVESGVQGEEDTRHAIVDVLCGPVVNVVIGVHVFVLSVPLVVVRVVPIFLAVILYQFIPLFHRSHFSHMFSLYSHGILGVVFTVQRPGGVTAADGTGQALFTTS